MTSTCTYVSRAPFYQSRPLNFSLLQTLLKYYITYRNMSELHERERERVLSSSKDKKFTVPFKQLTGVFHQPLWLPHISARGPPYLLAVKPCSIDSLLTQALEEVLSSTHSHAVGPHPSLSLCSLLSRAFWAYAKHYQMDEEEIRFWVTTMSWPDSCMQQTVCKHPP
jgi:hypothetical protein